MGVLMAIAFAGLGYRLVDLQVIRHETFRGKSEGNSHRTFLQAPKRGDIRDVRGNLLAGSIFVKTVCADPSLMGEYHGEIARTLAPILQMSAQELQQKLTRRGVNDDGAPSTNKYVVLKRKVTAETWERIQATMKQVPLGLDIKSLSKSAQERFRQLKELSVFTEEPDDQLRVYPNQKLAAHVLGYVGSGFGDSPKGKVNELKGMDGIEKSMDAALRGVVGWRNTEVARKKELVAFRDQDVEAQPGRNVVVTIDTGVQHIVESELAEAMQKHTPISASGIVVRPHTGEILALATLPNFDPNDLDNSQPDARRNRMIADLAEPGSTFKIVVISGALNDGLTTLEERYDCENGKFVFAGKLLHDHERYGLMTVEEIITKSSNIGAAKVGIKMGNDRLYQYIRNFGFGTPTGLPLVGERSGIVHPLNKWTKLSISRIPMGHEIAVTPLQMVMAMCAVANEGKLMRPMLVDRLEDDAGNVVLKNCPQQVRKVISEAAARQMVTALKTVVSTNGTGKRAMLEHYTAAGKTGTAQKLLANGTYGRKYFSSFIGFFPADNPEICVGIFLDEPKNGYYGGEAAGPVFRDIAERIGQYLAIHPDIVPPALAAAPGRLSSN